MIPNGKIGRFRVVWDGLTKINYLYEDDYLWMETTPAEKKTHQFAIDECEGKVLVAGLGLGYVPKELSKKGVSITVVEIAPEVKELVWKYLNIKGKIVIDDISHYLKTTKERFDYVYLDTHKNGEETKTLRELSERISDKVLVWNNG